MTFGGRSWGFGCGAGARVLLLAAFAALGCKAESTRGDDDDNGDGKVVTGTPVAAASFGQKFADAYCGGIGSCCTREGYAFTEATCVQNAKAYLDAAVSELTRYPGIAFNESAAGDCIALYRAAAQACTDRAFLNGDDKACSHIFQGTVPLGGHCSESAECADVPDAPYVDCDAGVCTRPTGDDFTASDVHAGLGDKCGLSCEHVGSSGQSCSSSQQSLATHDACWAEDGLFCGQTGLCQALPAVGAPCPDYVCAKDAYCDLTTKVCTQGTATGPCPYYEECLSTSYCDSDTKTCIPIKADGAACNYGDECQSDNCEGDVCRPWSIANAATCAGILDD